MQIRVLINSYACCPNMGSEPGMGWHWIVALAQHCECYIISEGEFRQQVEQWLGQSENKDIAGHVHFYWLPIGGDDAGKCSRIRRMCWNQGDWRFYYYYRKWQERAACCAREIVDSQRKGGEPIQVLHQLNMIGFREPGYLWRVSKENDIPLVWGPINAKEGFPMAYAKAATIRQKLFLSLKNVITRVQLSLSPRVRSMANASSVIIAASSDAQQSVKKYWHLQSICINETGCLPPETDIHLNRTVVKEHKEHFDILWCGRFLFSKQLDLAVRAIAATGISNIVLHVFGSGDEKTYRQLANRLGVNVVWHGQVSHDEVQKAMREVDILLFTSVFEGTPHVVLEAIENQLPVVCFHTCGQGDVVTEQVGITCPVSNPEQSVLDFAGAIKFLYVHPYALGRMRANCIARANDLTWDDKAMQMLDLYNKCCNE